jgi:hypothetical protein
MMKRAQRLILVESERRPRRIVAIALLALGSQAGCGREFFREWANQDVSEAVFEKSRDPRYRLDMFSIEPPALARFADPYDRDRPPAPPDDFAAQSLSPVPQWPDHRLLMPVEGTGYLRLLEEGRRYEPEPQQPASKPTTAPAAAPSTTPPPATAPSPFAPSGTPPIPTPTVPPAPVPGTPPTPTPVVPPAPGPGPAASRANSGPKSVAMTPISLAANPSPSPALSPTRTGQPTPPTPRPANGKDDGVRRTAMQDPARPMPTQVPTTGPASPPSSTTTAPGDPLQTPRIPGDPLPVDSNLAVPSRPPSGLTREMDRQTEEITSNLAKMFVPQNVPFDEAIAVGLPSNSRPYILTMEKAFQLGFVNSRTYQFQIENLYVNALPVTLQRFAFGPQFIAGLSPRTGVAGAGNSVFAAILPTQNFPNSFLYNTRATGSQTSALNMGTVAGVGKLFNNGTQILASFANQIVFNFVGKNPAQPTVHSFLPLQVLVPFLRGGGRAITLEGLTQAERSLLYSVRLFAKFRQEFVVTTLTGGTIPTFGTNVTTGGFTTGGNIDPTVGFLNVVEDVQIVENQAKNLAVFEQFVLVYQELINGESSGLSQLQLDQVRQQVQTARTQLINSRLTYRNDIDSFKIQLGMPPDVPLVIDRTRTAGFRKVFAEIDAWSLNAKRELEDLDAIVARLPQLEDLKIDGRSCHEIFTQQYDQNLEDLLLTAERIALENRLDLMNARAQLYDTWRQIRVSANALKGIFNIAITNQFVTPPTTNNPFGFLDQAKQFSLVINAELPLVRVAERNNFALQLINYQRQRRTLQNTEDFIKFQLRSEIRTMQLQYQQYLITQRNLVLSVRLKDQAFETIVAPPQATAGSQAALQTTNLIQFQNTVVNNENTLVSTWYQYQLNRLQVYRDLGILPFDEWEAYDEIFPPDGSGGGYDATVGPDGRPSVARSAVPSPGVRRN